MMLLTKQNLKDLPPLYSTEKLPADKKMAVVKFFNPGGDGSWFACEFDPKTGVFFGKVCFCGGANDELGYFSLKELQDFRGRFGLKIERDRSFRPTPISECKYGV